MSKNTLFYRQNCIKTLRFLNLRKTPSFDILIILHGGSATSWFLSITLITKGIYTGGITNWKTVGGPDAPILTIGREKNEALFSVLKKEYPFFREALFKRVVVRDNIAINIMKHPVGQYGIAFGAKPNFDAAGTRIFTIADFSAGEHVGLVYDKKNSNHPIIRTVAAFAASAHWKRAVTSARLLPP